MRLTFGKFNGARIDAVPSWYLAWLDEQPWLREKFPALAEAVARRLDALVRWHPDKPNGSHQAFLAVTDAVESLSKLLIERGVSA